MPAVAFLLAGGAAFVHAAWNVLVARARDPEAATALGAVAGSVLLAPVAAATWDVRAAAVPYIAASAVLRGFRFWLVKNHQPLTPRITRRMTSATCLRRSMEMRYQSISAPATFFLAI